MRKPNREIGHAYVFSSTASREGAPGYTERSGESVVVVRQLKVPEEADYEVGPMYAVTFADGVEAQVFEDELNRCLDTDDTCEGAVEYRTPLSGTGRSFPRCDKHWSDRLDFQRGIDERYPAQPPSDWSPLDAGESWDEDY